MKTTRRSLGITALSLLALTLVSGQAHATCSGGGGGSEVTIPLIFDSVATVNGKTPSWSGNYNISAPLPVFYSQVTTLTFSIRAKNLNLPDYTPLFVNLYTSDVASGVQSDNSVRWHCMSSMQVVGSLGVLKAYNNFVDELGSKIVRKLDRVVISDINGNVLAIAHP